MLNIYVRKPESKRFNFLFLSRFDRNYHVFYYLLAGAEKKEVDELQLYSPEKYHYLRQVNPFPRSRVGGSASMKCSHLYPAMQKVIVFLVKETIKLLILSVCIFIEDTLAQPVLFVYEMLSRSFEDKWSL